MRNNSKSYHPAEFPYPSKLLLGALITMMICYMIILWVEIEIKMKTINHTVVRNSAIIRCKLTINLRIRLQ